MQARNRLLILAFCLGLLFSLAFLLAGSGFSSSSMAAPQACVPGPHTGTLTADETWCIGDSPHLVNVQFTVPPTVTLTIEPGVTVNTNFGLHKEFLIQGHLEALGTETQPITFTSETDSAASVWGGLAFDGGTGNLKHVTLRYARERDIVTDEGLGSWARSGIAVRDVTSGELRLENTTIRDIVTDQTDIGLYIENSNVVVADSTFTGIGDGSDYSFPDTPIYISGRDSVVTLTNNTFTANNGNNIVLKPGAMMNHDVSLPPQDRLDGYLFQDDFTVPLTRTLTLEPGVTVRGGHSTELLVLGHLDAVGTHTEPITFTSEADSGASQWAGLVFDGRAGGGTGDLQHATVRYAGQGTSIIDGYHRGSNIAVYDVAAGDVNLNNVLLEKVFNFDGWHLFLDHGLYINNSRVTVADSIIEDNCDSTGEGGSEDSGIFVTGNSQVLIEGSLIQSNSAPGLLVEGDTAFVKVSGSIIANNIGDGVRNMGAATVILSGDAKSGNTINANQGSGVNQAGSEGYTIATYNW
jgi:hypothetical protein